jgi:hypothetical protein
MAIIGFTTKLELDAGVGTFTEITEVNMISLPAVETSTVETTFMGQSTTWRDYTPGLTDAGVLGFETNFSTATYNTLFAVKGKKKATTIIPSTGQDIRYRVTSPDENGGTANGASSFTFNGILTKLDTSFDIEGKVVIKGEVKVCGAITIAATTNTQIT